MIECRRCLNTTQNPTVIINIDGLCQVCASYQAHFDPKVLEHEFQLLKKMINQDQYYTAIIGLSGGKDSTVAAYQAQSLGFRLLGLTFDIGYYPEHIFERASWVAQKLNIEHEVVDVRPYITELNRSSYEATARLFEHQVTPKNRQLFREFYRLSARHYSVKNEAVLPYPRVCQLCRKTLIRAYYHEAQKRGIGIVLLGMNEWTGLSQKTPNSFTYSAVRMLQPPNSDQPPVFVIHLPFLLRTQYKDLQPILDRIGWTPPPGENLVESNWNSCSLARASEVTAYEMLGFHPDTTRLSREVTSGFLSKEVAHRALSKVMIAECTVRSVLQSAGILS